MNTTVRNGLLVLVTQVAMAGAIFAQSGAARFIRRTRIRIRRRIRARTRPHRR